MTYSTNPNRYPKQFYELLDTLDHAKEDLIIELPTEKGARALRTRLHSFFVALRKELKSNKPFIPVGDLTWYARIAQQLIIRVRPGGFKFPPESSTSSESLDPTCYQVVISLNSRDTDMVQLGEQLSQFRQKNDLQLTNKHAPVEGMPPRAGSLASEESFAKLMAFQEQKDREEAQRQARDSREYGQSPPSELPKSPSDSELPDLSGYSPTFRQTMAMQAQMDREKAQNEARRARDLSPDPLTDPKT